MEGKWYCCEKQYEIEEKWYYFEKECDVKNIQIYLGYFSICTSNFSKSFHNVFHSCENIYCNLCYIIIYETILIWSNVWM